MVASPPTPPLPLSSLRSLFAGEANVFEGSLGAKEGKQGASERRLFRSEARNTRFMTSSI